MGVVLLLKAPVQVVVPVGGSLHHRIVQSGALNLDPAHHVVVQSVHIGVAREHPGLGGAGGLRGCLGGLGGLRGCSGGFGSLGGGGCGLGVGYDLRQLLIDGLLLAALHEIPDDLERTDAEGDQKKNRDDGYQNFFRFHM